MGIDFVSALGRDAVTTCLMLAAPLLGTGLAIGLIIGVFQAITSVQEQTLSFIPKLFGVMVVFLLAMPWMLRVMTSYTAALFSSLARFASLCRRRGPWRRFWPSVSTSSSSCWSCAARRACSSRPPCCRVP